MDYQILRPSDNRSAIARTRAIPAYSIAFKFPAKVDPRDIKVFDRKINVINKEKFKKRHKEDPNDFIGTLKIF